MLTEATLMAGQKKLTVVISQHQGKNPVKRQLEEELAMAFMLDPEIEVSIVPNLYDLSHDHSGLLFLQGIQGDVVVLSWLFPRATQWILDRTGVKGKAGTVFLVGEEDEAGKTATVLVSKERHIGMVMSTVVPNKTIGRFVTHRVVAFLEEVESLHLFQTFVAVY